MMPAPKLAMTKQLSPQATRVFEGLEELDDQEAVRVVEQYQAKQNAPRPIMSDPSH